MASACRRQTTFPMHCGFPIRSLLFLYVSVLRLALQHALLSREERPHQSETPLAERSEKQGREMRGSTLGTNGEHRENTILQVYSASCVTKPARLGETRERAPVAVSPSKSKPREMGKRREEASRTCSRTLPASSRRASFSPNAAARDRGCPKARNRRRGRNESSRGAARWREGQNKEAGEAGLLGRLPRWLARPPPRAGEKGSSSSSSKVKPNWPLKRPSRALASESEWRTPRRCIAARSFVCARMRPGTRA